MVVELVVRTQIGVDVVRAVGGSLAASRAARRRRWPFCIWVRVIPIDAEACAGPPQSASSRCRRRRVPVALAMFFAMTVDRRAAGLLVGGEPTPGDDADRTSAVAGAPTATRPCRRLHHVHEDRLRRLPRLASFGSVDPRACRAGLPTAVLSVNVVVGWFQTASVVDVTLSMSASTREQRPDRERDLHDGREAAAAAASDAADADLRRARQEGDAPERPVDDPPAPPCERRDLLERLAHRDARAAADRRQRRERRARRRPTTRLATTTGTRRRSRA